MKNGQNRTGNHIIITDSCFKKSAVHKQIMRCFVSLLSQYVQLYSSKLFSHHNVLHPKSVIKCIYWQIFPTSHRFFFVAKQFFLNQQQFFLDAYTFFCTPNFLTAPQFYLSRLPIHPGREAICLAAQHVFTDPRAFFSGSPAILFASFYIFLAGHTFSLCAQ